jgi:predicted RNA-binding protein with PIN domain
MSLHYLLDGYNIIHQIESLTKGSLEDQRNQLVRYIEQNRPQGSLENQVTIVFDGRSDVFGYASSSFVKVVFSKDEAADEKIKRLVYESERKRNIVVVTNDREIQYSVRAAGAKAVKVEEFFGGAKKSGPQQKEKRSSKNISKTLEFKITDELEKIWLKKKK